MRSRVMLPVSCGVKVPIRCCPRRRFCVCALRSRTHPYPTKFCHVEDLKVRPASSIVPCENEGMGHECALRASAPGSWARRSREDRARCGHTELLTAGMLGPAGIKPCRTQHDFRKYRGLRLRIGSAALLLSALLGTWGLPWWQRFPFGHRIELGECFATGVNTGHEGTLLELATAYSMMSWISSRLGLRANFESSIVMLMLRDTRRLRLVRRLKLLR
jgi:hypothetical protein